MKRKNSIGACPLCGGNKKSGTTTYSVDLGSGVVVVRDVPATLCEQCGEAWIKNDTAKVLEQITQEASNKKLQIEVIAYQA